MVRKKIVHQEPPTVRSTRSKFTLLADLDDEFPALKRAGEVSIEAEPSAGAGESISQPANEGISTLLVPIKPSVSAMNALVSVQTYEKQPSLAAGVKATAVITKAGPADQGKNVLVSVQTFEKQPSLAAGMNATAAITEAGPADNLGMLVAAPSANGQPTQTQTVKEIKAGVKTWSTLFKDNRDPTHGIKLKYIPPKGKELDFSDKALPSMVEMWGYCLVGYFTGTFPGLKAIHELKWKWGVKCQVRSHERGWVIFKFQNELDRTKVLTESPYTVFGKQLILKELSEDFSFEDEEFLKVPIWVKFPKLPWKLWNDEAMSEVASMVGIPLTTDKITQEKTNHNFARVLIEVDVSNPPPLSFPIRLSSRKVFKQMVIYETFPNYCFHCKEYGHHPFICKKLAPTKVGQNVSKEAENETSNREMAENERKEKKEAGKLDSTHGKDDVQNVNLDEQGGNDLGIIPTVIVTEKRVMGETVVQDENFARVCGIVPAHKQATPEPVMPMPKHTAPPKKMVELEQGNPVDPEPALPVSVDAAAMENPGVLEHHGNKDPDTEEKGDTTISDDQYETEEEPDQEHHVMKTTKKSRKRKGETNEKYKRRLGRMIGMKIK
ncbi:unnamed protein product [Cuscuta epithymum]|uniref:DUF4283 domain-containing protein n=1 Tax=Cuscuta epithymum TaxID=186058 RepID=A0AAV0DT07_9ASTE|nr:unnamed protein product [Cuscuta epithymum]